MLTALGPQLLWSAPHLGHALQLYDSITDARNVGEQEQDAKARARARLGTRLVLCGVNRLPESGSDGTAGK